MEDLTICRCEDVSLTTIESCLSSNTGQVSLRELKLQTRAGMGICQGRTCAPLLTDILDASGRRDAHSASLSRNYPIRPVSLADLAGLAPSSEQGPRT